MVLIAIMSMHLTSRILARSFAFSDLSVFPCLMLVAKSPDSLALKNIKHAIITWFITRNLGQTETRHVYYSTPREKVPIPPLQVQALASSRTLSLVFCKSGLSVFRHFLTDFDESKRK